MIPKHLLDRWERQAELLDTWVRSAHRTLDRPTMSPLRDTDEWCGRRGAANRLLNVAKAVRGVL